MSKGDRNRTNVYGKEYGEFYKRVFDIARNTPNNIVEEERLKDKEFNNFYNEMFPLEECPEPFTEGNDGM